MARTPEGKLHSEVVAWLRKVEGSRKNWFTFTHLNGGKGRGRDGAIMKQQGWKPGFPDLMVCSFGGQVTFIVIACYLDGECRVMEISESEERADAITEYLLTDNECSEELERVEVMWPKRARR